MMLPLVLVVASLVALFLLFLAARGQGTAIRQFDEVASRTRPVDLDAFRNLIDPQEEEFLRESLPPGESRTVLKERLHAATEYVANTAHNAAILLRLGEAAMRSPDPQIASAGRQLVETALRLRLYALLSIAKLWIRVTFPGMPLSLGKLADSYQRLSGTAAQLALVQQPRYVSRLSANL